MRMMGSQEKPGRYYRSRQMGGIKLIDSTTERKTGIISKNGVDSLMLTIFFFLILAALDHRC